jgi:hypothetical protein
MPPDVKDLEFKTDLGKWRVEYIGDPLEAVDSGRVEYNLRFKWIDPHDPENKETPEQRLRLFLYEEDMTADDSEEKLVTALGSWISNCDAEIVAKFEYESPFLKSIT